MEDGQIDLRHDAYDRVISRMSHLDIVNHLSSQVIKWEKFNAYRPPDVRRKPIKNNYALGSFALALIPSLFIVLAAFDYANRGYHLYAVLSLFGIAIVGAASYGLVMIFYVSAKGLYDADAKAFEHWEELKGMYFAGARRLLPQALEPVEVTHDTYRARPGETLMLAIRVALFAFRDRVVSRSQSGGVAYQESATLRHNEGVGLLAVTTKGLNFLSDDHRSNIFLKWKDIAMLETEDVYLMVQPYSGKVRFFAAQGVGVDPASDPVVLKLYIESVRELAEA